MNLYVQFNKSGKGAKIYKSQPNGSYLLNPSLDNVRRLSPELWQLKDDGTIVPMENAQSHMSVLHIKASAVKAKRKLSRYIRLTLYEVIRIGIIYYILHK